MSDMTQVIKPKTDQLNSDDLIGGPLTVKITGVKFTSTEQPVSINFEGDQGKPFKPCKSMCRVLVMVWGPDAKQYVGKSMTLFRDPEVVWAGMKVGGIRISHMSHIDKPVTMSLTATKQTRKPYTVKPLIEAASPQPSAEVLEAGSKAASQGVEAYTKWLQTLDAATKETIKDRHAAWSKIAKEASKPDEEGIAL